MSAWDEFASLFQTAIAVDDELDLAFEALNEAGSANLASLAEDDPDGQIESIAAGDADWLKALVWTALGSGGNARWSGYPPRDLPRWSELWSAWRDESEVDVERARTRIQDLGHDAVTFGEAVVARLASMGDDVVAALDEEPLDRLRCGSFYLAQLETARREWVDS